MNDDLTACSIAEILSLLPSELGEELCLAEVRWSLPRERATSAFPLGLFPRATLMPPRPYGKWADEASAVACGLFQVREPSQLSPAQWCVVNCMLFCVRYDISLDGVLGFTVHKAATSSFFSIVMEFVTKQGRPRILSHYPNVDCSRSEFRQFSEYDVTWNTHLLPLPSALTRAIEVDAVSGKRLYRSPPVPRSWSPFCCREVIKMHDRRLQRDSIFQALLSHEGSQKGIIYEVKTMQMDGPIFERRFYILEDSVVHEVEGVYTRKVHAFKNYSCARHELWFSVDLYADDSHQTGACHHMRMTPFTHIQNPNLIHSFFNSMLAS